MKYCSVLFICCILSGCSTLTSTGKKPQYLDAKNLNKDPQTGIYTLKTSSSKSYVKNENPEPLKIAPGIPLRVSTNKIESYNISKNISTNISDSVEVKYQPTGETAKPSGGGYFNLIIYYIIILHAAIIYFFLEKKGFFQKQKNPFKQNYLPYLR